MKYFMILVIILLQSIVPDIVNAKNEEEDKTLSPYFLVLAKDSKTEQLPLYSTSADVNIVGVIADVTVTQVYKNAGNKPIEAIYVFPASTRAAVYSMTMKIGQRLLIAEIQKKEEARKTYENAKKEGKSASLLEELKPNVFQMNVANIMPGDTIVVELKYTELLIPEDKIYEFVYPTVVGPRYSNTKEKNAKDEDKFVNTPYQHEGEKPLYKFDIYVTIDAGMPLDLLECNTHKVKTEKISDNASIIRLDESEHNGGNKDYILKYRLAGDRIKSGLLLSKGMYENFFLLMLQPPKRVTPIDIPSREYIFIIDVSGSMHGFPLDISKNIMRNLFKNMKSEDRFNVLLFAGSSKFLSCESMPATKQNIDLAMSLIDKQSGGGGTELLPALTRVMKLPKTDGYSRTIAILTDGYVQVEEQAFDLIRNNLNQANVFTFGIGTSVNRYIIEGMARVGQGEPFVALNQSMAEGLADKFYKYIESPIMTDININYEDFKVYDVEPITIPDVLSDRPIIVYGKWKGDLGGKIQVVGTTGKTKLKVDIPINAFATIDTSQALKYLWARKRIEMISDYNSIRETKERIGEITDIGLKYNLLTKYTSFVAVDYVIRNHEGKSETVKQALPLPEGVSDLAVGEGEYATMTKNSSVNVNSTGQGYNIRGGRASEKQIRVDGLDVGSVSADALAPASKEAEPIIVVGQKMMVENTKIGDESNDNPGINEFIPLEKEPSCDVNVLQKSLIYPEIARRANIEGKVLVRVLVGKNGKPIKAVIQKSDAKELEQAAIDAIMKTQFTSGIQNGKPVESWVSIPVIFKLNSYQPKLKKQWGGTLFSPSNIEIIDIKEGKGETVEIGSNVTVHYKMFIDNCNKIEDTYKSGQPLSFVFYKDKVMPAIQEAIIEMKAGGKRIAYIHAEMGYDDNSDYKQYKNQKLILEIELIEVK